MNKEFENKKFENKKFDNKRFERMKSRSKEWRDKKLNWIQMVKINNQWLKSINFNCFSELEDHK